ncbi:MAG: DUF5674 family protein [Eubacterium sp.]|nr:DUF5674 family protein [Eubacterium sp.]
MQILSKKINKKDLFSLSDTIIDDNMIKAVVDVGRRLVAIDAPMHADIEQMLLEDGAKQEELWGINFYPDEEKIEDFVEFDSLINIRPRQNKHLYIDDEETRNLILEVVTEWILTT